MGANITSADLERQSLFGEFPLIE